METDQAQALITAIITQPTASAAVEYAWENRERLLSPVCFRVLMDMLAQESEQNGDSKRYQALTQLKQYRNALFQMRLEQCDRFDQEAIATTLPALIVVSEKTSVQDIVQLFKSGDIAAQRAFIEACPYSKFKDIALDMIHPYSRLETVLMGLNILARSYCKGNCELGIVLSKAFYLLSQEAFNANPSTSHLTDVGQSAINCAICFSLVGQHEELIQSSGEAIEWLQDAIALLKKKIFLADIPENEIDDLIHDKILKLFQYQIEAHIELAQFDEAEAVLNQVKQLPRADQGVNRYFLERLEQRFNEIAGQSVTDLPPEDPANYSPMIKDMLHDHLKGIESFKEGASPEEKALLDYALEVLKPQVEKEVPESMTKQEALKWFAQQQKPKPLPSFLADRLRMEYPHIDFSKPQSVRNLITNIEFGEIPNTYNEPSSVRQLRRRLADKFSTIDLEGEDIIREIEAEPNLTRADKEFLAGQYKQTRVYTKLMVLTQEREAAEEPELQKFIDEEINRLKLNGQEV